jgi:glycerophosphoryl diester phosphodiesterase
MDISTLNHPLIFAHRGFSERYPENTMKAFHSALIYGAQLVELDVRLTKDEKVVVIHDDSVDRTTNGQGPVCSHTLAELEQLDAGSWFNTRFSGERIPTLEEVLVQFSGKLCFNIELKTSDVVNAECTGDLERSVIALIKRTNSRDRVLISSFDPVKVGKIRELDSQVRVGLIAHEYKSDDIISRCRELRAYSFHPNLKYSKQTMIEPIQKAGFFVFPFNIKTQSDLEKAQKFGVDGYFVNDPEFAQMYLKSN